MRLLRRLFKALRRKTCKIIADVLLDTIHNLLKESVLIRFQRQNIVTVAVNDLFGDRDLSPHRINCNDGSIY